MTFQALAASAIVALVCSAVTGAETVAIGSRLELLVDDHLIEKLTNARQVLHHPMPQEVAIVHDKPWEGNICCYHTVFQDGGLFRMYYRGAHADPKTNRVPHQVVCYAESKDGIHWTKPELGLVEFGGSRKNNILWNGAGSHNFTPFRDENPQCAPDARYKAIGTGKGGLIAFKSPDAIHWTLISDKPVITKGAFDSQNLAFWDPLRRCYVDFHRQGRDGVRDIMTCTSQDFRQWTDPVFLTYPGAPKEHLYTNAIRPYYRAPHIYLGFPKRFLPSRRVVEHANSGVSDGVFMSSRDGRTFKRWLEAFIRPGLQRDRWVCRNNMTAWGILVTKAALPGLPDELSLFATEGYYTGASCQLRRYTLRIDGFVSVQAPYKGGELLTKPLIFAASDKPAPEPMPQPAGPMAIETAKPLVGKRSLVVTEATYLTLPGTKHLGAKVTFAAHVRGCPAGHRRLFSAYDGGKCAPNELNFDFDSDTDLGQGAAVRFTYHGVTVRAPSAKLADWSGDKDTVHHIAATYDDGAMAIYFDGKLVAKGGQPGLGPITLRPGDLRFGEDYPPTSLTNEPFLGAVDDILVLRRVLSPEEIATLAQKGAAAVVKPDADEGVLYTMETDEEGTLADSLPKDGRQDARVPGPAAPGEAELVINYSTSAAGSIRCEIRDAAGKPIPGYTLREADEIIGDHIERAVSWRGRTEVKPLAGKPIRLRFVMKDADLYSLRFR